MKYEIPKEIKSTPKIRGLEMRELVIILISSLLLLTILRELVHSLFILFYFGIAILGMIYLFLRSGNNHGKRKYESIVLILRHKTNVYPSMDKNEIDNEQIQMERRTNHHNETLKMDQDKHGKAG